VYTPSRALHTTVHAQRRAPPTGESTVAVCESGRMMNPMTRLSFFNMSLSHDSDSPGVRGVMTLTLQQVGSHGESEESPPKRTPNSLARLGSLSPRSSFTFSTSAMARGKGKTKQSSLQAAGACFPYASRR
jgi:hypothetical protein